MGKKLNNLKIFVFFLLVVSLMTFASASVSLVTPASSATVSTTVNWNASFTSFANVDNCSVWLSSASTANSTAVNISTATNVSTNAVFINGTFNSLLLEDSNDYSVYASCINLSNVQQNSSANTGITIDNTVPVAASSLSPATNTIDADGSVAFSGTVTGSRTTGCTLFFDGINPGSGSYTMTHSSDSCTYTLSAMSEQTYKWYIRASDNTNTTDSATTTLNVDVKTSAGKAVLLASQPGVKSEGGAVLSIVDGGFLSGSNLPIILIVLAVIVVIVVIARRK